MEVQREVIITDPTKYRRIVWDDVWLGAVCLQDGQLVTDIPLHDKWHTDLEAWLKKAKV